MNSWEHFHNPARAFPRAGVPINGQQITLPLSLYGRTFGGKRSWQALIKKDNSASRVLHSCLGRGAGLSGWGEGSLLAAGLSCWLGIVLEGGGGVSRLMDPTKGPVHIRMLSVASQG